MSTPQVDLLNPSSNSVKYLSGYPVETEKLTNEEHLCSSFQLHIPLIGLPRHTSFLRLLWSQRGTNHSLQDRWTYATQYLLTPDNMDVSKCWNNTKLASQPTLMFSKTKIYPVDRIPSLTQPDMVTVMPNVQGYGFCPPKANIDPQLDSDFATVLDLDYTLDDVNYHVIHSPLRPNAEGTDVNYFHTIEDPVDFDKEKQSQLIAHFHESDGGNRAVTSLPNSISGAKIPFLVIICDVTKQASIDVLLSALNQLRFDPSEPEEQSTLFDKTTPIIIILSKPPNVSDVAAFTEQHVRSSLGQHPITNFTIVQFPSFLSHPHPSVQQILTTKTVSATAGPTIKLLKVLDRHILNYFKDVIYPKPLAERPSTILHKAQCSTGIFVLPKVTPHKYNFNTIPHIKLQSKGTYNCPICIRSFNRNQTVHHTVLNTVIIDPISTSTADFFEKHSTAAPHIVLTEGGVHSGADLASDEYRQEKSMLFNRGMLEYQYDILEQHNFKNGVVGNSKFEPFPYNEQSPLFYPCYPLYRHYVPEYRDIGELSDLKSIKTDDMPTLNHPYALALLSIPDLKAHFGIKSTEPPINKPQPNLLHANVHYHGADSQQQLQHSLNIMYTDFFGQNCLIFLFNLTDLATILSNDSGTDCPQIIDPITAALGIFDRIGFQTCPVYFVFVDDVIDTSSIQFDDVPKELFTRIAPSPWHRQRIDGGQNYINSITIKPQQLTETIRKINQRSVQEHSMLYLQPSH